MKANMAYKYRIYPNEEQKGLIAKTFGSVRFVFNKMLGEKISYYNECGESLMVTPAKYKSDFPWLTDVDSLALANAQLNLEAAYKNFFSNKTAGFPKFKSKKNDKKSYTTNNVNNNIRIEGRFIKLPKLGMVKVKLHRPVPCHYRLKSVTVSQIASGKYFVSVLYEHEFAIMPKQVERVIGLDFSMRELYISSEGENPSYPRYYRRALEKLKQMQRRLSKMEKFSNNYHKHKRKIAKLHEHIANSRKDFLHKQSRQITNAQDAVGIENLNMRAMARALNFGKSVHDNGWGMFVGFLGYKLAREGKRLVKIDKWYPSSKTCSSCGVVKSELALGERIYICGCGNILDRDVNAAINIKNEAIRILEAA